MANLGSQLINQSYQDLLQITSSNAVQKGDGTSVSSLAITSSTTSGVAPAITGNTNNRVLTATGGETINGESNLTFDGTDLSVAGNIISTTIDTQQLAVNGYVATNLSPTDATFDKTLGQSDRTWNQVYVGTNDGSKTAFFGEDLLNNPGELFIRTDGSELKIRAQGGIGFEGNTTIPSLYNDTLNNNVSISTPSLISTNLVNTNSASFGSGFTPTARVHISGASNSNLLRVSSPSATNALFVSGSGNVGIGTTTPQRRFEVSNGSTTGIVASFGAQISNNNLSGISFGYAEASHTNYRKSALVFERTETHGGGANVSGKIHFLLNNNSATPATASTDAVLTIDSVGTTVGSSRVGIGTRFPTASLHISGTVATDNLMRVQSTTGVEYFFISASGNVGIGTNTPSARLHITGSNAIFTLSPIHPLPTTGVASASFATSGSGANLKPYFWNGSSWNALY